MAVAAKDSEIVTGRAPGGGGPRLAVYRPWVLFPLLGALGALSAISLWVNWFSRLPHPRAVQHLRRGDELMRRNDGIGAVSEWRLAARLDPNYAAPYRRLGDYLLNRARRPDLAWRTFGRLAQIEPDGEHVYCQLAEALALDNENEDAKAAVLQAVRLEPDCGRAHVILGTLLMNDQMTREALGHLERAYRLAPHDLRAGLVLAQALLDNTEFDAARRVLDQIIRDYPQNSKAHYLLGRAHARSVLTPENVEAALQHYRTAIRLEPDAADIYADLGKLQVQLGRWAEARTVLEKARRLDRRNMSVAHNLAAVYRRLHLSQPAADLEKAARVLLAREQRLRVLLKRFNADPGNRVTTLELARTELDDGNLHDALKYTNAVLRENPTDREAMRLLEQIYTMGGKPELAEAVRDHLRRSPEAGTSSPSTGPSHPGH